MAQRGPDPESHGSKSPPPRELKPLGLLAWIAGYKIVKAILATLGTMQFFAGIAVVLAYSTGDSGASVTGIPGIYSSILNGSVFGIPTPLLAFLLTTSMVVSAATVVR